MLIRNDDIHRQRHTYLSNASSHESAANDDDLPNGGLSGDKPLCQQAGEHLQKCAQLYV
jgi:hypothetical protein